MQTYKRNVLIRSWRRRAPTASSAKLASHTRLLATIVTCVNCLLFALVLLFPSHKRLRFHLIYRTIVRLSFVCGSLVGAVQVSQRVLFFSLANEWHNKWTILVYARAECCPPLRGRRGFPQAKRGGGTAIGKTPWGKGKVALKRCFYKCRRVRKEGVICL